MKKEKGYLNNSYKIKKRRNDNNYRIVRLRQKCDDFY